MKRPTDLIVTEFASQDISVIAKKLANKARGTAAKAAGDSFEHFLDEQHELAANLGILCQIEHNQARSKVVGGRTRFVGKGISDYSGVLFVAKALALEAKSTKKSRLPRSAVAKKQADHMNVVARAGGLALLLVEFRLRGNNSAKYVIPWLEVPWKVVSTAESLDEEDIDLKWHIVDGECYLAKFMPEGKRGPRTSFKPRRVFARD